MIGEEAPGEFRVTLAAVHQSRPSGAATFPGKDWAPPGPRLPGPFAHVRLVSRLGRTAGRDVWAGESAGRGGEPLIVELLAEPLADAAGGSRWVHDLRPWAAEGWPACAVVTRLPASLPDPYPRFQLLSFVGMGGMGQVWMAEAPDYPDLPLAIKFFTHPVYRQHPALLEQCLQEATVGIGIDSPFVARTYQLLDLRGHQAAGWPPVALVMRLYEPSLERVLADCRAAQKRLPLAQVIGFARNLLDALDALHAGHRLVHRDVKPSNVLLRLPDDRPYRGPESLEGATALLADLGTLGRRGQVPVFALGQDGWKAPELFGTTLDPDRPADPAEDLYSFGLILRSLAEVAEPESLASLPPTVATVTTGASPAVGGAGWLRHVADELTAAEPLRRLTARAGLRGQLAGPGRKRGDGGELPPIEHYKILDVLGRGGSGEVYKAKDPRLCRVVALKVIRGLEYSGGDSHERFRREAVAVARLNHPNIVQIFEVGEADCRPFFTLEYCAGGNLAARVAAQPLPPDEAARVVQTLARAMHFAHQQGVIHRDLKPSNVLLTEDGVPKITDFGLAKQLGVDACQTQTGAIMGTPSYMAPEQAAGRTHEVGPSVDVYALGAILNECLTGRPPFRAASALQTLELVRSQPPPPPSTLQPRMPRDLETICLKCLEKDPYQRYASAGELADELERYLQAAPIHARPAGVWERARRLAGRRPAAAVALVLGLLLLGQGAANVLLYQRALQTKERDPTVREAAHAGARELLLRAERELQAGNVDAAIEAAQHAKVLAVGDADLERQADEWERKARGELRR